MLCVEIVRIWNSFIYDERVKETNDRDKEDLFLKGVSQKNRGV